MEDVENKEIIKKEHKKKAVIISEDGLKRINSLREWLLKAEPKSRYVYHYGQGLHDSISTEVVKNKVFDLACEGKIYIFQPRDPVDTRNFFYIAIKASKRVEKLIPKR